jgi:hypothetical protein
LSRRRPLGPAKSRSGLRAVQRVHALVVINPSGAAVLRDDERGAEWVDVAGPLRGNGDGRCMIVGRRTQKMEQRNRHTHFTSMRSPVRLRKIASVFGKRVPSLSQLSIHKKGGLADNPVGAVLGRHIDGQHACCGPGRRKLARPGQLEGRIVAMAGDSSRP